MGSEKPGKLNPLTQGEQSSWAAIYGTSKAGKRVYSALGWTRRQGSRDNR